MLKSTLAAAAVGLMLAATPATAGSEDGHKLTVKYRDLDLSTAEGQKTLDRRIDQAAREVCGVGATRTGTRLPSSERKKCMTQARAVVKDQVAALIAEQQRGG